METSRTIDVTSLDPVHLRALKEVIGAQLRPNQRLVVGVTEIAAQESQAMPPLPPTLEEWASVYEGLSHEQIEEIDRIAKMRAKL